MEDKSVETLGGGAFSILDDGTIVLRDENLKKFILSIKERNIDVEVMDAVEQIVDVVESGKW